MKSKLANQLKLRPSYEISAVSGSLTASENNLMKTKCYIQNTIGLVWVITVCHGKDGYV